MIALRRIAAVMAVSVALLSNHWLFSQTSPSQSTAPVTSGQGSTDQDIKLLRKDLRSQKKQMIAANMDLTDEEAKKFWPIYEQYTDELVKINNAKYDAVKQYVQNYDSLTDAQALSLVQQVLGVDQSVALLRQKYIPIVGKVLPGKKTALFLQLDRRLVMLIDLQLAAAIPMVNTGQ